MATVTSVPYLEKRPSGFFFRRRIPGRIRGDIEPSKKMSLCLSLRTHVLGNAKAMCRQMTDLTDLAFALTETTMEHLGPQNIAILEELARFLISAHEAARALADPRSEAAANFAAQAERAAQDTLRRAIALGDRTPAVDPLRQVAARLGIQLDENAQEWKALAFEALRIMLDAARERELREVGGYEEPTVIFRSVMSGRVPAPRVGVLPARSVPAAAMLPVTSTAAPSFAGASSVCDQPAPLATHVPSPSPSSFPVPSQTPASRDMEIVADPCPMAPSLDQKTMFLIQTRPPRLENIDLRVLTPEMQDILRSKPRGILLSEGIELFRQLKAAGYGDTFEEKRIRNAVAGEKWKRNSGSNLTFAARYWPEFTGDVPFEEAGDYAIMDAIAFLGKVPAEQGKGKDLFSVKDGYREMVERVDIAEEERIKNWLADHCQGRAATPSDWEQAIREAKIARFRADNQVKHRRCILAVGRMLYDLQLIDRNPFSICSVSNAEHDVLKRQEEKRVRDVWDDRIYQLLATEKFQGDCDEPGDPLFWIPLICRLNGLRTEEAAQLGPDDFGTQGGIAYLDVKMLDGNNVKTSDSQRRIPVNPQLLSLGLLELVALRTRQGHHRLFPFLSRGESRGKFSEIVSKRFTYYRQTHDCYWPGLDLHAMRTSFHGDLMNEDKSDAIRCHLMGHASPDEGFKSYSQGLGMQTLFERVSCAKIDISRIVSPFAAATVEPARGNIVQLRG